MITLQRVKKEGERTILYQLIVQSNWSMVLTPNVVKNRVKSKLGGRIGATEHVKLQKTWKHALKIKGNCLVHVTFVNNVQ